MPRKPPVRLGDTRFDHIQDSLDLLTPLNQDDQDLNLELEFLAKCNKLSELMEHFEIDSKDENCWFHLSFCLADSYVPGMNFKEKYSKSKKWNFFSLSALYALVQITTDKYPNMSRQEIFNKIPVEAQNTSLAGIITKNAKPITLESWYDRFANNGRDLLMLYLDKTERTESEDLKFFLNDKYKTILDRLRKKPEHELRLVNDFIISKIKEK